MTTPDIPFGTSSSTVKILKPGSKWRIVRDHYKRKPSKSEEVAETWQSIVRNRTENFFGISTNETDNEKLKAKWNAKMKQLYGEKGWLALRDRTATDRASDEEMLPLDRIDGAPRKLPKVVFVKPKENVLKIAYDAFKGSTPDTPSLKNRSFAPSVLRASRVEDPHGFLYRKSTFFDQPFSTGDKRGMPLAVASTQPGRKPIGLPDGLLLKKGLSMDEVDGAPLIVDGIDGEMLKELSDNARRDAGTGGFIGKYLFGLERDESKLSKQDLSHLEAVGDLLHRPYFTYWITFVQIVCYIVTICVYGIAPIGFYETVINGEVLSSGLFVESVSYIEKDNFWIGPRQADLIHLGAKYSPCMRKDSNVEEAIREDRVKENGTACCVRNDGSGCVQTPKARCSSIMSTWYKRDYGTVCGQDPDYCLVPASRGPYRWPNDIIDWPICTTRANETGGDPSHMSCTLAGKPCCIGIQGECTVTTREHCQFLRGYFHEEAFLCSQVSCMSETCGMLPFWEPTRPDQFYRLWISLFIHAGLIQLIISIVFQFLYMRDVEKMMGWFRTAIIYIFSGIVGSLASAIFIPYHVEAGPSGSQFGILSCIFVELIHNWKYLVKPYIALIKLIVILLLLFIVGLLPMIDNYAHLFGFVFGFLLSFAIMPHVELSISERCKKLVAIFACLFGSFFIFLMLTLLFYVIPIYECHYCQYFSCIPFAESFCDSMEVKIRRTST